MPAILYCYSNMGRHYIHEYLTPSERCVFDKTKKTKKLNKTTTTIKQTNKRTHKHKKTTKKQLNGSKLLFSQGYEYILRGEIWVPLIGLTLIHVCAYPKRGRGFPNMIGRCSPLF